MTWSPARYAATLVHSKCATVPSRTGTPPRPSLNGTPANLSSFVFANWFEERDLVVGEDVDGEVVAVAKCLEASRGKGLAPEHERAARARPS